MAIENITLAGAIFGASLAIGIALQSVLRYSVSRWASRTESQVDDHVLNVLSRHMILWSLIVGSMIALPILRLPPKVEVFLGVANRILFLLSLTFLFANIAALLIPLAARRFALPLSTTSFSANMIRLLVFLLGSLLILTNLGISIGPVLTALGVGSLAVGLALQDILANLFAGFYLFLSRQIQVGDHIEIDRGGGYAMHRGQVVDINWRVSRLRSLANMTVEIPNSFITQSIIRQLDRGSEHALVPVEVQLGGKADLAKAEQLARETAQKLEKTGGRLQRVLFLTARDPLIMTVVFEVPREIDQELLVSPFNQMLRTRLAAEGLI